MARIASAARLLLLTLALCGCTCGVAGCARAEAEQESRFRIEMVARFNSGDAYVLTDTETGKQWLYVRDTTYDHLSIDVEPMGGGE